MTLQTDVRTAGRTDVGGGVITISPLFLRKARGKNGNNCSNSSFEKET